MGKHTTSKTAANAREDDKLYDVAIIGAGVVGCALAFRLSRFKLNVLVLDKNSDVGEGTSKANSALICTGFDAKPDSLEASLITAASVKWPKLANDLKIPFKACGALMVAFDHDQLKSAEHILEIATTNGVDDVRRLTRDETLKISPHLNPNLLGSLHIPRESIVDPFMTCVAFGEVAAKNGAVFKLGFQVCAIEQPELDIKTLVTNQGERFHTRLVINAAGLGSLAIAKMYQGENFELNPRRGQFLVYDKAAVPLTQHILLPVPTAKTKGILATPTIFGNLLAGPTAEDLSYGVEEPITTIGGLEEVRKAGEKWLPGLANFQPITTFAGLRCHSEGGTYQIRLNDGHPGFVTITGIRSTGLTTSFELADHVIGRISNELCLELEPDRHAVQAREQERWPGWWAPPYDDPQILADRPEYGKAICYCEQISKGEIMDALQSVLPMTSLSAIKRRTRAMSGRCNGFNCQVRIAEVISQTANIPLHEVTLNGPGTEIINHGKV